ncbi:MAG: protein-glutamate O-methyltransferase CheR [Clostridium sp.]|nr:protein-glutamate O-methyltransferase CheR [Clostridium sp.]
MEFVEFYNWVHKEMGLSLNSYKPTQLNRRIGSLMERIGVNTLDEYANILKNDISEKEKFLDYITINVTEFFRNPEFFESLRKNLLKEVLSNRSNIKIWSAGSSMGCEAYSLAMMLDDMNTNVNYSIIATDIDKKMLEKARLGIYSSADIKSLNTKYLDKYFKKSDDKYIVDFKIKSKVKFKRHDLILDKYEKDFDLILCRNVIIYFKDEVKQKIVDDFIKSLRPGGLLFVGATESINTYKTCGIEKLSPFIYKKI